MGVAALGGHRTRKTERVTSERSRVHVRERRTVTMPFKTFRRFARLRAPQPVAAAECIAQSIYGGTVLIIIV